MKDVNFEAWVAISNVSFHKKAEVYKYICRIFNGLYISFTIKFLLQLVYLVAQVTYMLSTVQKNCTYNVLSNINCHEFENYIMKTIQRQNDSGK